MCDSVKNVPYVKNKCIHIVLQKILHYVLKGMKNKCIHIVLQKILHYVLKGIMIMNNK